jgi:hypothetical protein
MVRALSTAAVPKPLGFHFLEFYVYFPEGRVIAGRGARGEPGGIPCPCGGPVSL